MLSTKLTKSILHTTDNYISSLEKWWVKTIWDFISLYPRDFEDKTNVLNSFALVNLQEKNTIRAKLLNITSQTTRNNKILVKAMFEDKDEIIVEAVWFNMKFLKSSLEKFVWKEVLIFWKPKYEYWKLSFASPKIETDLSKTKGEITPVYWDVNYIPWEWIWKKMELLQNYFSSITETLPKEIIDKHWFISRAQALYKLHFPSSHNDLDVAKYRLAYEELFEIQFKALNSRFDNIKESEGKSFAIPMNAELVKEIIADLPFELTDGQKIVLFQCLKDMEKWHSMNRLLQWDVWTWKTIVCFIAILHAILESTKMWKRLQACIMAPTAILATQHFNWVQDLFMKYGITNNLIIWATTAKNKKLIKQDLKNGQIDVIIWTHALIEDDVEFNNLWLVIIDEQHRFWVRQREALEKRLNSPKIWKGEFYPHNLNMTATPIPRTLALTLYWDQDLSVLSEYPKWRQRIYTKVISWQRARDEINLFIEDQMKKWRQVFWVSPLVEESEKMDLANAINTYNYLVDAFPSFNVWLIHWKMSQKEKDEIMNDFWEWKTHILSSTSVIEVWIDVPNASVICIEWAERFGLSQLHQFRWRVWRGKHSSYCYLFPTSWKPTERLKAMENTNSWFELSEIDLELRWPWEVYGVRQSWLPDLKLADLKDLVLVSEIREDIQEFLENNKNK